MRSVLRVLTIGVLAAVCCTAALAQGAQTGGVTGVVTDPQGAVVPGATVDVINETTGKSERRVSTGEDGSYTVTLLPPGTYRLEVTAANFKKTAVSGVPVRITETARQNVELAVGGVEETVQVQAEASLINTTNATTGQPLASETIAALPLPVPNYTFLLNLSAGTASELADVRSAGRGNVDINVNGQRTTNNSVSLEGINVNDFNLAHFDTIPLPNPNTIQEFKVSTSLYDASQGSKGGGAIGVILKSGTKDFHADAYWSHRNDALNANEWFRNASGLSKRARLLQNVFGGSGSGPFPGLGGFFFANYQGVRARNGIDPAGSSVNPLIQAFPTNSDGTTSAALLASAFGLTPAQIDPVAVSILNLRSTVHGGQFYIPRPGQSGCQTPASATGSFRCTFSAIAPIQDDQYTISYDRDWRRGNDKVSARWFYDDGNSVRPFGAGGSLGSPTTSIQNNRFLSLSHTHIFSPTTVNEARFGLSRFISSFAPEDIFTLGDVGATRPNASDVPGIYALSVTGLFSLGVGVNDERGTVSNNFFWTDTLSMTKGNHALRMGGDFTAYQLNRFNRFAIRGSLTFGATTGAGNTFTAFQNFLQGRVTAIQSGAGDPQRYFRAKDWSLFFQDDWRVRPNLTVNLGLRLETMNFGHDKYYRQGIYDPGLAARGVNPFLFPEKLNVAGFTGTPGVSDCGLDDCFDENFAPRVGFAWDLRGDQKTVVRGGYGIYYQRLSNQNILQGSLAPPFFVQLIDSRANPAAFQLANPLAAQPAGGAIATAFIPSFARFAGLRLLPGAPAGTPLDINNPNVGPIFVNEQGQACANYGGTAVNCVINLASFTSVPRDAYTPYTQQFNIGVQRDLGHGFALEAAYVGARYTGGLGIWDPYLAPLASPENPITVRDINGVSYTITTNTTNNEELRHQVIGLSRRRGSRYTGNIGYGMYHSGQFTLLRRFQNGLYFQAAYTVSRNMDNVSGSQSTDELNATKAGQAGANLINFQNNPQANYARSDFDRPHRLVVSWNWELPVGRGHRFLGGASPALNHLVGGWAISGIATYQSGLPFSTFDSTSGGAFGATAIGTGNFTCGSISQAYTQGSTTARITNYLNPACFTTSTTVPNGTAGATGYGDVPRNAFRGPFQQNWDISIIKRFDFWERHRLTFRTDFFNAWNHPVFDQPSSVNVASPATFGQITRTIIPARLIQFGLKYDF